MTNVVMFPSSFHVVSEEGSHHSENMNSPERNEMRYTTRQTEVAELKKMNLFMLQCCKAEMHLSLGNIVSAFSQALFEAVAGEILIQPDILLSKWQLCMKIFTTHLRSADGLTSLVSGVIRL